MQEAAVTVAVNITVFDLETRELYCPINFMFGKDCNQKGTSLGVPVTFE